MTRLVLGAIVAVALGACGVGTKPAVLQPEGEDKVTTVTLPGANVYFVETDRGYLMVDAGMSARESAVAKLFSTAGIDPDEVDLIVVTHAHPDHVAGLSAAARLTGARVLCHRSAAEFLEQGRSEPIAARGLMSSIIAAVTPKRFGAVNPQVLVDGEYELSGFGLAGRTVHGAGHSAGSISLLLANGEALVGDQVRGEDAALSFGRFYEDRPQLLAHLERVASAEPRLIHMSHGRRTDTRQLADFLEAVSEAGASGGAP